MTYLKQTKTMASLVFTVCLLILCACQKARVENDPNEQKQIIAVAESFLTAMIQQKKEKVLQLMGIPFVADKIYETYDEIKEELDRGFEESEDLSFKILSSTFLTRETLDVKLDSLIEDALEKYKWEKDTYFVKLKVIFPESEEPTDLYLMLRQDQEGYWKIYGLLPESSQPEGE